MQNYGPEGDVLLTAYTADFSVAFLLCCLGAALFSARSSPGSLAAAGYCILGAGILIGLLGMFRVMQLADAGRNFRAGRPFNR